MAVAIHGIQTGLTQIKTAQRVRKPGGLVRILTDTNWTGWLPIYAWVIEHPEGLIVVDTGETSLTAAAGYFPDWHPYYRGSVRMRVKPEDEIGPQMAQMGIRAKDVKIVVLTHLHTDHAGGLSHFASRQILVSEGEYRMASGVMGKLRGYLPHRWPEWFAPAPIAFGPAALGPFDRAYPVTRAADVLVVPTPGHTSAHVSVVVESEDILFFLAGDTSYSQKLLLRRLADGVSPSAAVTLKTIDTILTLAGTRPLVYMPSHDPESVTRMQERSPLINEMALEAVAGRSS
jgi:glyoxylase-like metal-dependent hydrolase (beta-lactamase superfamily II)